MSNKNIQEYLKKDGMKIGTLPFKLRNDKKLALIAVSNEGESLLLLSDNLKNDKEIVLAAVKQNGNVLKYASKKLQNDKEVVLNAIQSSSYSIKYASEVLKNDKEVVIEAVKRDSITIKWASKKLRGDKEIILIFLSKLDNGEGFNFIRNHLKDDNEIILAALKCSAYLYVYTSERFKLETKDELNPLNYLENLLTLKKITNEKKFLNSSITNKNNEKSVLKNKLKI